jgi:predicted nuclease of restriction endonuclease-like (RecB) superfamily
MFALLSVKNPNARSFYETEALRLGWFVRQLDRQIGSMFYERIALSKNKAAKVGPGLAICASADCGAWTGHLLSVHTVVVVPTRLS